MQNLEILHEVPVTKAAGAQENVLAYEQHLITEKDVEHPRPKVHPRRDHTSDHAAFVEGEPERPADDTPIAQDPADLVAGVGWKVRVGVEKQEDVPPGNSSG